jgi:hypothetical protein
MGGADDIDIRGGGAVSVDPETLRAAAAGFGGVRHDLDEIATTVGTAGALVAGLPRDAWALAGELAALVEGLRGAAERAARFDGDLRDAAAVHDLVEWEARRAVAAADGRAAEVDAIDAEIARIVAEHPGAPLSAALATLTHDLRWPADLAAQATTGWWWMPMGGSFAMGAGAYGVAQMLRRAGAGTVAADARLRPHPAAVQVTAVHRGRAAAPASLAEVADRVPGGGDARVRVERYAMPDGSRQFVVYVAGTQAVAGVGGADPFDELSNLQLYSGTESASYDAALEALRQSGAQPGDVVHQVGHSQGAMITAHVALEGGFDAQTLISFGSPVEADVGDGTLAVSVRHTDDPVAALEGGGHAQAVGAPGSFIAEREADPAGGPRDLRFPAHAMSAYAETAAMLDASADPRMDGVRGLLDELATATSVQAVDYGAVRVAPQPHPVAGPPPVPPAAAPHSGGPWLHPSAAVPPGAVRW